MAEMGEVVRQIGKERRGDLKITRVSPGGKFAICVPVRFAGRIYNIRVDRLRKVSE